MTRATVVLTALTGPLLATGCLRDAPPPDHTAVFGGGAGEWIELSHAFGPSTIYWPTDTAGFQLTELAYGHTEAGSSTRRTPSPRPNTAAPTSTRPSTSPRGA